VSGDVKHADVASIQQRVEIRRDFSLRKKLVAPRLGLFQRAPADDGNVETSFAVRVEMGE
jgi:hypothetical protein